MPGHLFTEYFLTDGIRQTPERQSQRSAFVAFRDDARRLFQDFPTAHNPNETQTEQDLIRPLLQLLGWTDDLPQQTSSGGENIPDLLLFPDAQAKTRATGSKASPFLEALAVAELKRFRRPLDTRGPGKGLQASSPHAQILRYLREAETVTDGHLRWGILTNGSVWRLYDQKTRPRATAYYEADLQALLQADDQDALRSFHLLFRRSAFVRRPGAAATFVEAALDEGKRYEQRVAQSLAGVVFERVFPRLLQALADTTDQPMPAIREAALILLYRLLFVLYAEDRGLLPVNDAAYDDYGLRKRVRDDVAQRKTRSDTFSTTASSYYSHLTDLFAQIDQGDPSIGLPPYNGGLFAKDAADLLNQVRLPDDVMADVVHGLSHTQTDGQPGYVNYRDMSVQQLGSIYERLLEQEPVLDAHGQVHIRPNPYARKDSGSFYTPQDLVDLIVDQTLTPLIEERLHAFESRAGELQSDRRPKAERRAELARLDPAQAVLDLKVLDPAMGSGHFLVSAVDFLTDYIADLVEFAPAVPDWLDADDPYHSPLLDRVAAIRADILHRAHQSGWAVNQAQLTDQAIIRRLVLKRCIYGVDKNPLHGRTRQGLPLAPQLHRRRAPLLPGPSPALRRLPPRPPHRRRQNRATAARGPNVRGERPARRRKRRPRHAPDRTALRRRRSRSPPVRDPLPRRRVRHRRPPRLPQHPRRPPLAHRRHASTAARNIRGAGGRDPGRGPHPSIHPPKSGCRFVFACRGTPCGYPVPVRHNRSW